MVFCPSENNKTTDIKGNKINYLIVSFRTDRQTDRQRETDSHPNTQTDRQRDKSMLD